MALRFLFTFSARAGSIERLFGLASREDPLVKLRANRLGEGAQNERHARATTPSSLSFLFRSR